MLITCSVVMWLSCDRFGNEIAGVEDLGTTGRGGDMQVSKLHILCQFSTKIQSVILDWNLY